MLGTAYLSANVQIYICKIRKMVRNFHFIRIIMKSEMFLREEKVQADKRIKICEYGKIFTGVRVLPLYSSGSGGILSKSEPHTGFPPHRCELNTKYF